MPRITPEIIVGLAKSSDDFGFEMRVGRDLRSFEGVRVRHAETYVDPRTGTERHFDYQCTIRNEWRRLQLAIECKNLFVDSPVVISGHKRIRTESFHDMAFSGHGFLQGKGPRTSIADGSVSEVCKVGPESDLYSSMIPTNNFVGKSAFRPKPPTNEIREDAKAKPAFSGYTITRDKDDYDRWNQAVGSAGAMALRSLDYEAEPGRPPYAFTVTLPIVVVPDGALWRIEFDENGEIIGSAVEAEHLTLFRDHRFATVDKIETPFYRVVRLSHIHFMTAGGLSAWMKTLSSRHAMLWEHVFREDIAQEVLKRFR